MRKLYHNVICDHAPLRKGIIRGGYSSTDKNNTTLCLTCFLPVIWLILFSTEHEACYTLSRSLKRPLFLERITFPLVFKSSERMLKAELAINRGLILPQFLQLLFTRYITHIEYRAVKQLQLVHYK